jgi:N-acetyl-anhydromuramyl-L-alanine amidase AmpD
MKKRSLDKLQFVVLHHSASPPTTSFQDIREWHMVDRGWEDVGYHFVIDLEGIHTGRPVDVVGAHCQGFNTQSIGICLTGDNTKSAYRWTPQQKHLLKELLEWLAITVAPLPVTLHSMLGQTLCPGLKTKAWEELRDELGVAQYYREGSI